MGDKLDVVRTSIFQNADEMQDMILGAVYTPMTIGPDGKILLKTPETFRPWHQTTVVFV